MKFLIKNKRAIIENYFIFPNNPLMIPFVTSLAAVFTTVVVAFSTVVL